MLKLLLLALLLAVGWWLLFHQRRAPPRESLTPEEARAVLGLGPDADAEAIRLAHRRLIAQVHPDAGGSAELARRVNLARDIALAALSRPAPRP